MKKILNLIINLFLARWNFKKPDNKKFLIYDREGSEIFSLFLKKNSFEILDIRGESVNFYILLYTVYNNGFLNFIKNYKINYIKIVAPKFAITIIDNNLSFYQLKDLFNKTIFISIQGGRRDNIFFDQCKHYYLKTNKRLSVDYFFVLGRNEIKRFDKYINTKFYLLGSLRNNHFTLKEKNQFNNKKKVLFISKKYNFLLGNHEIRTFNAVYEYCLNKGYQLSLCTRSSSFEEKYYRDRLIKGEWIYIPYSMKSSYNSLNSSDIIVYTNSTLGLEALIKNKKVIVFPLNSKSFPIKGYDKVYGSSGPFWMSNFKEKKAHQLIRKVENYTQFQWKFIIKKYVSDIISYNPNNTIFMRKIK
jgi:hypothetical protein